MSDAEGPQGFAPPAGPTTATTRAPRGHNPFGTSSLILGVIAGVMALLPLFCYIAWLIGLVGLILGVVGLSQRSRPRGLSLPGVIVSVVAIVLSVIMSIVYTMAIPTNSVSTTPSAVSAPSAEPSTATASPSRSSAPERGTLGNPYPAGTVLDVTGTATAQLSFPKLDLSANDAVASADQSNDAPASGMQWALLTVHVTNNGSSPIRPADLVGSINLASHDGQLYGEKPATLDNLLSAAADTAPGTSSVGQIAYQVPVGTTSVLINAGQAFITGQ